MQRKRVGLRNVAHAADATDAKHATDATTDA